MQLHTGSTYITGIKGDLWRGAVSPEDPPSSQVSQGLCFRPAPVGWSSSQGQKSRLECPGYLLECFFHSLLAQKYLIIHPSVAQSREPQDRRPHPEDSLQKHISDPNKNANKTLQALSSHSCLCQKRNAGQFED